MKKGPLTIGIAIAIAAPLSAQSKLARPVIDSVNHHLPRVMNAGPTAWTDTNGWRLVLERSIQPAEGQRGMLEKPSGVVLLPDGRVIVSQRSPALLTMYDARGQFLRTLGREGDGPGEYHRPQIAMYHDTVVTYDANLGRVTLLTLDGKFVRTYLTNLHASGPPIAVDERGRLKVERGHTGVGAPGFHQEWMYFDLAGKKVDSIAAPEPTRMLSWDVKIPGGAMSQSVPFTPYNMYSFFRDGSFVVGGTDRYELFHMRSAHDTVRIFGRRNVSAEAIPAAIRDSEYRQATKDPQMRGVASASDMPRTYGLWDALSIDGLGNIWVSIGRDQKHARFDVFSASGNYLGVVPSPIGALYDGGSTSWSGDRLAVIKVDENELPVVRIYRIDRRGK